MDLDRTTCKFLFIKNTYSSIFLEYQWFVIFFYDSIFVITITILNINKFY